MCVVMGSGGEALGELSAQEGGLNKQDQSPKGRPWEFPDPSAMARHKMRAQGRPEEAHTRT